MNAQPRTQRRRNVAAAVLCCLAAVLHPGSNSPFDASANAMAAEKGEPRAKESETGDPVPDAPAQSEASKNGGEGSPAGDEPAQSDADEPEEIFVPSEDISEDIDVPFPVDI